MPRRFSPDIVLRQTAIGELCLAPDGSAAVYTRREVCGGEHVRHLWLVPWGGGRPRRLTRGQRLCSGAAFSPDGTRLAYLCQRAGEQKEAEDRAQVWILPLEGGEPWPLTCFEHGASELCWSPDGRRLAVTAADAQSYLNVGERKDGEPTARVIGRIDWRFDGAGLLDRHTHLHLVAARPGARPRRLTKGGFDVSSPRFAPDGRIVYCADPGPDADLWPRQRLFSVTVAGGRPRPFLELAGDVAAAAFAPDASALAVIGTTVKDSPDHAHPRVLLAGPRGGEAADLAPRQPELWGSVAAQSDLEDWTAAGSPGPVFAAGAVVALVSLRGRTLPWRFERGRRAEPLYRGDDAVCLALAEGGGRLAVVALAGDRAPEVYALEDGGLRRLTRNGSAWLGGLGRAQVTEVECPGPAGPIRTTLCSPPGAGPGRLPLVVSIHGGPVGAWTPNATLEAELLVARGFRVALPDIRGSAGYGVAWLRQLEGAWGEADRADVLAVVDDLVGRGLADRRRVAALGLSYGGFVVNWLLATSGAFACGVSENGVTNQVSTWGNCDSGVVYDRQAKLGDAISPAGVRKLWNGSPLKHVRSLTAPLLLLQAEGDLRCPAADNEQLFVALRTLGRDVTYVTYPEESHGFQVTGRPDRRHDRAERMVEFLAKHLGGGPRRRSARAARR